jgi:putative membrane protein
MSDKNVLAPSMVKNDKKAKTLIYLVSAIVFIAVVALKYLKLEVDLGFDVHLFAKANATINGTVAIMLLLALVAVKMKNYGLHKTLMLVAMGLSVLFLLSYIAYHLFTAETPFPADAPGRGLYLIILATHIILAGLILPFILFSAYRALIGEYAQHKKLARITWPIWFYVAVTGVVVYWMISPYYGN